MSATLPPDDELHNLLQSWDVELRDDPTLASRVWARIAAEKPRGFAAWIENVSSLLAKPAAAFAAVAMFAAVGAIAAQLQGSSKREAQITRLAAEYAQSIDPILMTHPPEPRGHTP